MSYLRYPCLFAYSGVQHVFCCIFRFVCLRDVYDGVHYILYCVFCLFVFIRCLVYPTLPVSLDCKFLIAPSLPFL